MPGGDSNPAPPCQTPARGGTTQDTWSYKMFRGFNAPGRRHLGGVKARVGDNCLADFGSERLVDRFVRALAARRAIKIKEVFESFEFFARVHRRVRAPHMIDLCCGHGLTGVVFALLERRVERVTLLDQAHPPSLAKVLAAAADVAPWVAPKIRVQRTPVDQAADGLAPGTSVIGVHACGVRTDACIDVALATGGPIAVMPCCYHQTDRRVPSGLRRALGRSLSTDVHRTYTLERAGYSVDWTGVPMEITRMNRILVATPGEREAQAVNAG